MIAESQIYHYNLTCWELEVRIKALENLMTRD